LPGYKEKDVAVVVKGGEIEIIARKSNEENVQNYLNQKLKHGVQLRKKLPEFVDSKNFSKTMRNGVLELVFGKKNGGRRDERRKIKIN
jgi:Molecular chaperone (small heat shock protein)